MDKKREITKLIHELKKDSCITKRELEIMFKSEYKLHQLMLASDKTMKELTTAMGMEHVQNWYYYKDNYSLISIPQVEALATALNYNARKLYKIIEQDIITKKNK